MAKRLGGGTGTIDGGRFVPVGPGSYDLGPNGPSLTPTAATLGEPLPIVWGLGRVEGHLIYASPADTPPGNTLGEHNVWLPQTSGAGVPMDGWVQGIGSCNKVIFALCEAVPGADPATFVNRAWSERVSGALLPDPPDAFGFELLTGNGATLEVEPDPTAAWSEIDWAGRGVSPGVPWRGTAQVRCKAFTLADGKIPKTWFEVRGRCAGTDGQAHPADVMADLLCTLGPLQASQLEVDVGTDGNAASSYRTYCTAMGFKVNRVVRERTTIRQLVDELLVATNSTAIWSEGKVKILPLGDQAVPPNGATYTPAVTAWIIDDDEILRGGHTVEVERVPYADTRNCFPVEIASVEADYEPAPYEWIDPEDPDRQVNGKTRGVRRAEATGLGWVTSPAHALKISELMAKRSLTIRNQLRLGLNGSRWCLLEPGDVIAVTHAKLGLSGLLVRIQGIEESDGGKRYTVTAKECPEGSATPVDVTPQRHDGFDTPPLNPPGPPLYPDDTLPGNSLAPAIAMVPYLYARDGRTVAIATGGGSNWGGCEVHVSWDGSTYGWVGDINRAATYGTLAADLAGGDQLDDVNSATVSLLSGTIDAQSAEARDGMARPLLVGGEILSWVDAVGGVLSSLRRGAYGTARGAHSTGAAVIDLSTAVMLKVPENRVGSQMWVKLLSFNKEGRSTQNAADVTAYTFTTAAVQPPCPESVGLTTTNTKPDAVAGQWREASSEEVGAIQGTTVAAPQYAVLSWSMEVPIP